MEVGLFVIRSSPEQAADPTFEADVTGPEAFEDLVLGHVVAMDNKDTVTDQRYILEGLCVGDAAVGLDRVPLEVWWTLLSAFPRNLLA